MMSGNRKSIYRIGTIKIISAIIIIVTKCLAMIRKLLVNRIAQTMRIP